MHISYLSIRPKAARCVTVSVTMSAVCLKLVTILCLCCTVFSGSERNGVIWKNLGESITIQCRLPNKDSDQALDQNQDYLYLRKGLAKSEVLSLYKTSKKEMVEKSIRSRLQTHGDFPNLDILIKNLTLDDTNPYWCEYKKISTSVDPPITQGQGSILLVVKQGPDAEEKCEEPNKNLVLIAVVISAVVLLSFLVIFFIWIIKTRALRPTAKPQRVSQNDVYEDMRGTIRR